MQLEDTLREALQRDAAELVPVGPGPDVARRRAFRRKRRIQSGVVVVGAVGLVGGSLAVIENRPAARGGRVEAHPTAPTSDLEWHAVDGTVLYQGTEFTTTGGVTYALSTAPGTGPSVAGWLEPQELYATHDGATWTHASLGASPWVVDLTESKGVLYAVGTGPGTQGNPVDYKLSTSSDGGAHWSDTPLPVKFTPPQSSVALTVSRSVHVARGEHTTVAMAKVSYWPDITKVIGQETAYNVTPEGVQILGKPTCDKTTRVTPPPAVGLAPDPCTSPVVATRPWSDFGISDPAALHQQQVLVRDDGGSWSTVDVQSDPDSWVQGITATSNGFLMAEQVSLPASNGGSNVVKLFSSPDGRSWTPLTGVPSFQNVSISGDRIIGVDMATSDMYVSNDAGLTWNATRNIAGLLPGGTVLQAGGTSAGAGPLGYAATVYSSGAGRPQPLFLLNSSDGVVWKLTDMASVGAPRDGQLSSVSVGADHIDVAYEVPASVGSDGSASSYKLVDLLGTPKA